MVAVEGAGGNGAAWRKEEPPLWPGVANENDGAAAPRGRARPLGVAAIFIFPAFGGFLFGYDIGSTSYVIDQLGDADAAGTRWHQEVKDSSVLQGFITSSGVGGAFAATCVIFRVADALGRRREMLIAAALYLVGGLLEAACANDRWSPAVGIPLLMCGRWIYGIGCGFAMHGIPAYIGEMAPSSVRGVLISCKEAVIVLGMLAGYAIGFAFKDRPGGWRYTYGATSIFAVVFFVGVFCLPPSARWLCLRGREDEMMDSLLLVYDEPGARAAMRQIRADVAAAAAASGGARRSAFDPRYRASLAAGCGLVFAQQVTGQPSVLYYANTILKNAGLQSYAAVLVGAFKLVATLFAVLVVERAGRRFLLFAGITTMAVSTAALTFLFIGTDYSDGSSSSGAPDDGSGGGAIGWRETLILVCMFSYIGGYQVGFGPIAWLMTAEVFPLEVRGAAIAVAVQQNFFWNFVVSTVFPLELAAFGPAPTFALFSALCAASLLHVRTCVPETKGLELEEIRGALRKLHSGKCGTDTDELLAPTPDHPEV